MAFADKLKRSKAAKVDRENEAYAKALIDGSADPGITMPPDESHRAAVKRAKAAKMTVDKKGRSRD